MPAPTVKDIDRAHTDRLVTIHNLQRDEERDSFEIYRETLRRMWTLCPSDHDGDKAIRAWWRTYARNAHLTRRDEALDRADHRHLAANKHRARMLALTQFKLGSVLLDILEG